MKISYIRKLTKLNVSVYRQCQPALRQAGNFYSPPPSFRSNPELIVDPHPQFPLLSLVVGQNPNESNQSQGNCDLANFELRIDENVRV